MPEPQRFEAYGEDGQPLDHHASPYGGIALVTMNHRAHELLDQDDVPIEHLLTHHHQHLARRHDCLLADAGLTSLNTPDGDTVLLIQGPNEDGAYRISGLTRSDLQALLRPIG